MRFFPFLRSSSRRDENGANGKGAASANELLERAAFLQAEAILAELKLSRDGLTDDEAARRREQYGLNQVAHEKPPTWYAELGRAFANPFNFLLTVLAVVSALTGDDRATFVIGFMVVLSTGLRFVQEFRSNTAARPRSPRGTRSRRCRRPGRRSPRKSGSSPRVSRLQARQ